MLHKISSYVLYFYQHIIVPNVWGRSSVLLNSLQFLHWSYWCNLFDCLWAIHEKALGIVNRRCEYNCRRTPCYLAI